MKNDKGRLFCFLAVLCSKRVVHVCMYVCMGGFVELPTLIYFVDIHSDRGR